MEKIKSDKQYEAEYDARTLAIAEEIRSDKKRFAAAKAAISKMIEEKMKETESLQKVKDDKNK